MSSRVRSRSLLSGSELSLYIPTWLNFVLISSRYTCTAQIIYTWGSARHDDISHLSGRSLMVERFRRRSYPFRVTSTERCGH